MDEKLIYSYLDDLHLKYMKKSAALNTRLEQLKPLEQSDIKSSIEAKVIRDNLFEVVGMMGGLSDVRGLLLNDKELATSVVSSVRHAKVRDRILGKSNG